MESLAEKEEAGTDDEDEEKPDAIQLRAQLDWKDYVALAIAALETVMLPMVILIAILVALLLIVR